MNQGIVSAESIDIRRALDRLQGTLEEFADRQRELRRDRRQMSEYIVELEREVDRAAKAAADESLSERRQSELLDRIGQLEQAVRERESLVAEQEDLLQQYQARFDEAREFAAKSDASRRELESELGKLRTQRGRPNDSRSATDTEHVEMLNTQLAEMRQVVERIEAERGELVANHSRLSTELEIVRQSEQSALAQVASLEAELARVSDRERSNSPFVAELEKRNAALESELASVSARLREIDSGHADTQQLRLVERELERSRAEIESLKERLAKRKDATSTNGVDISSDEREAMIGQLQSAIGIIDRYLSEA